MAIETVKIDFNVNDDTASLRAFLERLTRIAEDQTAEFALDLSKCQYLGPDAAATLAAVILDAKLRHQKIEIKWPEGPKELRSFCEYSGLQEIVQAEHYSNKDFDPKYNVLRLRVLTTARFRDADPVITLVRAHIKISDDMEEYLRICVNEVVQNIQDHAKSKIGGVLCARFMTARPEIRIAIVDRGEGIYTTLKRRYRDTTELNALARVMGGRYTTLSRENNAGLGINHLKSIVTTLEGELSIISERAVARTKPSFFQVDGLGYRFQGTGVFFTLPVKNV